MKENIKTSLFVLLGICIGWGLMILLNTQVTTLLTKYPSYNDYIGFGMVVVGIAGIVFIWKTSIPKKEVKTEKEENLEQLKKAMEIGEIKPIKPSVEELRTNLFKILGYKVEEKTYDDIIKVINDYLTTCERCSLFRRQRIKYDRMRNGDSGFDIEKTLKAVDDEIDKKYITMKMDADDIKVNREIKDIEKDLNKK